MSDIETAEARGDETLAEFFAATMRPQESASSFTPSDVAGLIRRDRDSAD